MLPLNTSEKGCGVSMGAYSCMRMVTMRVDLFKMIDEHTFQHGDQWWGLFEGELGELGITAKYNGKGLWVLNGCILLHEDGNDE